MSEDNQPEHIDFESYFKQASTTSHTGNIEPNEEADYLFTGTLDEIDTWERIQRLKIYQKNQDSERELREENASKAFIFSAIWASFIALIILLHAMCPKFKLSEVEFLSYITAHYN